MSDTTQRTFSSDFKQWFLRGLVVLLPTVLTLWIVVKAYQFVDSTIAEPINRGVRTAMVHGSRVWEPLRSVFDPPPDVLQAELGKLTAAEQADPRREGQVKARLRSTRINEWWASHWYMDLIGLVVAVIMVYVAGRLLGGFFGRRIYRRIERFITTLPIFKQVYPYVKQVVDFLFSSDRPLKFNRVVVVEYPRKGVWSLGFMTGATMRAIAERSGDAVTVFIPSSPTPFTGYTITVPLSEVREVPITVEEAIRFVVSGGVLVPDHQLPAPPLGEPEAPAPPAAPAAAAIDVPSGSQRRRAG